MPWAAGCACSKLYYLIHYLSITAPLTATRFLLGSRQGLGISADVRVQDAMLRASMATVDRVSDLGLGVDFMAPGPCQMLQDFEYCVGASSK